ncbi:hypothetical protein [Hansschlegelia sp. KR7-227]|jgi:hypothetical protein|uniref:hypothetical protein n=1 Tax=Hansschlegelia sp. KR7-227 TaxID=3400914 RepID=UPI003C10672B
MTDDIKRSADFLATNVSEKIQNDAIFRAKVADDPGAAAAEVQALAGSAKGQVDAVATGAVKQAEADTVRSAASADKAVYIFAVAALSVVSVGVVLAIGLLAYPQIEPLIAAMIAGAKGDAAALTAARVSFSVPDGLIALGSAAIGALAGLLGPLSQRR